MIAEVKIGKLVRFVTVDRGIDIDAPSGTLTKKPSDRLSHTTAYYPRPGEVGLVVAGPDTSVGGKFKIWHVLVGESMWWFNDDEICAID